MCEYYITILTSKTHLLRLCHRAQSQNGLVVFALYFQIRRLIGDFGVPIAIFFMIAVDINIDDAYTQVGIVKKKISCAKCLLMYL